MADIDLLIEDSRWEALDLDELARLACEGVFAALEIGSQWEVSVLACDDARIAALNTEFRDKPTPTNVLSWPSQERSPDKAGAMPDPPTGPDTELGDLAIAYDTCLREADAAGKPIADHVTHLLVHGVLHLLGFDHINDADADLMEGLETRILANLGLPDPYRTA